MICFYVYICFSVWDLMNNEWFIIGGGRCNDGKIESDYIFVRDVWCRCGDWSSGWEWGIEDLYI